MGTHLETVMGSSGNATSQELAKKEEDMLRRRGRREFHGRDVRERNSTLQIRHPRVLDKF